MTHSWRLSFLFLFGPVAAVSLQRPAFAAAAVVQAEALVVQEQRLTGSPATVSRLELGSFPGVALSTAGVATRAANFFVADSGARSFTDIFALRGLTNTPVFGDPAISVYLDDLPLGSGFTFPGELAGFARAELHRGPGQNTVFGRAGSAGVLQFTTPAPAPTAQGEVRTGAGNHDARAAFAQLGTASGAAADAWVAASWTARGGHLINTTLQREVDDREALSAIARVRHRPADTAELALLVTAFRARDGAQPLVPLGGPLDTVARSAEGLTEIDAFNAALKAAFATSLGRLTATTSFTDWRLGPYANTLDFGFAEMLNQVEQRQRNWSGEFKLVSGAGAPVRWQAGAFLGAGDTKGMFVRLFGPFVYEDSSYEIEARSLAGFGEMTFDVTPALGMALGVRAEVSRKEFARRERVPVAQTMARTHESTALLPKLAALFRLNRTTSLFASVGAGYKPGGFSAFTGNAALAAFGAERTKAFEAGVTHSPAGDTFSATARFFRYGISGYQIERSFATGGPADDYLVVNAARARSIGAELEVVWRPLPGLSLAADAGWTDVTLRDIRDPFSGARFDGRRAPAVPTHDLSLRAEFAHNSGFFAGVVYNAVGRTNYTEDEEPMFAQRSYGLVDARIGYTAGAYRVTVYGANLTGEAYHSSITPGTGHGTPGAPRTHGIEVGFRW